ncbi:unnamed protein product [Brassica oleracea]|uniref:(rape) hypothetical protein n=1 Tax=Brassica napus TaxID=3708 RepID=A0A816RYC4_BRANA|nr:unnamed protein product [Brassica napus]
MIFITLFDPAVKGTLNVLNSSTKFYLCFSSILFKI